MFFFFPLSCIFYGLCRFFFPILFYISLGFSVNLVLQLFTCFKFYVFLCSIHYFCQFFVISSLLHIASTPNAISELILFFSHSPVFISFFLFLVQHIYSSFSPWSFLLKFYSVIYILEGTHPLGDFLRMHCNCGILKDLEVVWSVWMK